jgi:hypothetical protein
VVGRSRFAKPIDSAVYLIQIKNQNKVPVPDVYFGEDETRADFGFRRKEQKIRQTYRKSEDEIVSE